jgi:hypothetical protein
MHLTHEIRAGIKRFFVCSVYGLALGIGLLALIWTRFLGAAAKSRSKIFFANEEFLNMNPSCRPSRQAFFERLEDGVAAPPAMFNRMEEGARQA